MISIKLDVDQKFYILLALLFIIAMSLTTIYGTVVDIGAGITHQNHEDTITTPLPGNCGCGYPDCGGCSGQPEITLQITETVAPIPTFPNPATPDIPDATQFPTTFPTFDTGGLLPTPIQTAGVPTIIPTLIPPNIPASPVPVG